MPPKPVRPPLKLNLKEGSLHRKLHTPQGQPINPNTVKKTQQQNVGTHIHSHGCSIPVTPDLKRQANFAANAAKWKRPGRKK